MFCKFCGAEIEEESVYCQKCGKKTDIGTAHDADKERPPKEVFISDVWIWSLAIIPIAVTIAFDKTGLMSKITSNADIINALNWILPIALNIFFINKDNNTLINAGIDSSKWFYIGVFLVPLYLIVREIKTNRNYVPTVIWLFLFAVDILVL